MPDHEVAEITPINATQEKTYEGDEERLGARLAIDKDLATGAGIGTEQKNGGWWKADFGNVHFIHKVIIHHRFFNNWFSSESRFCSESVSNFERCLRSHNNTAVSVYLREEKKKSCGTLKLTSGLEQSDQIYTLVCNIRGDSLILSKTTGNIGVTEVIVIGRG